MLARRATAAALSSAPRLQAAWRRGAAGPVRVMSKRGETPEERKARKEAVKVSELGGPKTAAGAICSDEVATPGRLGMADVAHS